VPKLFVNRDNGHPWGVDAQAGDSITAAAVPNGLDGLAVEIPPVQS
jgi:hypothetical protein